MTENAQAILTNFDGLPETDQREVAAEILRRTAYFEYGPLNDETMVLLADELFVALDNEEAANEKV
jgi:hypothetical protein